MNCFTFQPIGKTLRIWLQKAKSKKKKKKESQIKQFKVHPHKNLLTLFLFLVYEVVYNIYSIAFACYKHAYIKKIKIKKF